MSKKPHTPGKIHSTPRPENAALEQAGTPAGDSSGIRHFESGMEIPAAPDTPPPKPDALDDAIDAVLTGEVIDNPPRELEPLSGVRAQLAEALVSETTATVGPALVPIQLLGVQIAGLSAELAGIAERTAAAMLATFGEFPDDPALDSFPAPEQHLFKAVRAAVRTYRELKSQS